MHQFYHVSLYGQAPTRGAKPHEHARGIAREAARIPSACTHLEDRKDPVLLHGGSPEDAAALAMSRAKKARDSVGRRLRRDGAALAAIVVSYPVVRRQVEACSIEDAIYQRWKSDVLTWLRGEYGGTLLSVVEHVDEEFLHLHAFAVPDLNQEGRFEWQAIHPGRKAQAEAASRGAGPSDMRAVYREAMGDLQTRFHVQVSSIYGHDRHGPRRARLARAEAKRAAEAERANARLAADEAEVRAKAREEVQQVRSAAIAWAREEVARANEAAEQERQRSIHIQAVAEETAQWYENEVERLKRILTHIGLDPDQSPGLEPEDEYSNVWLKGTP